MHTDRCRGGQQGGRRWRAWWVESKCPYILLAPKTAFHVKKSENKDFLTWIRVLGACIGGAIETVSLAGSKPTHAADRVASGQSDGTFQSRSAAPQTRWVCVGLPR